MDIERVVATVEQPPISRPIRNILPAIAPDHDDEEYTFNTTKIGRLPKDLFDDLSLEKNTRVLVDSDGLNLAIAEFMNFNPSADGDYGYVNPCYRSRDTRSVIAKARDFFATKKSARHLEDENRICHLLIDEFVKSVPSPFMNFDLTEVSYQIRRAVHSMLFVIDSAPKEERDGTSRIPFQPTLPGIHKREAFIKK
jgi:hypothetical protein